MIFDYKQALKASANNVELAERLLTTFVEQIPEYQTSINANLSQNNIENLRNLIHKLHGAVEYLGVPELKQQLKSMNYDADKEQQWLKEFTHLIEQLERIKQIGSYQH